jgi:cytochrome c biogenesis protein CcmG/thiol:disulfide interchange protein DsbE
MGVDVVKRGLWAVLFALFVSFVLCSVATESWVLKVAAEQKVGTVAGALAPDFQLQDGKGKLHSLQEYRGKWLFVNFWASWCGPCRMELPTLAEAAKVYGEKVQVVGINLTERDDPNVVQEMLKRAGAEYLNLYDKKGEVADRYLIRVIPTSFLIDPYGKVAMRFQGPITTDQFASLMRKLPSQ